MRAGVGRVKKQKPKKKEVTLFIKLQNIKKTMKI